MHYYNFKKKIWFLQSYLAVIEIILIMRFQNTKIVCLPSATFQQLNYNIYRETFRCSHKL